MYKRKKVTETDFPEFKLQNSLSNSVTLKNQSVSKGCFCNGEIYQGKEASETTT